MKIENREIIQILREKTNTKDNFIKLLDKNLKLKIPKNSSYEKILKTIHSSGKESAFCKKVFGCNSIEQIIEKYDIHRAMDVFSRDELILIADMLSLHKMKWAYNKTTLTGLVQSIVNNTTKEDLHILFERLILEKKIPNLIQHYKWVVGPLGITRATEERKGMEADDLIELLSKYLTIKTYDEFKKRTKFLPIDYKTGTANELLPIKFQQLIITFGTKKQILQIFNELIEEGIIRINNDYDYYTFKVTPCGVFFDIPYEPTDELVDILMNEVDQDALEKELQTEGNTSGPLRSRLVGMTVVTPPESILDKMFGLPVLRRIGKNLGLVRIDKISNKSDLIRYLLIKIGFSMPKRTEGITQYIRILDGYLNQVKNITSSEKVIGIMTSVYVETEKILKDLIYFHISCLWPEIKQYEEREKIMEAVHEIVRKEFDERKDISRYTFGQLIRFMVQMNKYAKEKSKMHKIIHEDLCRRDLFPPKDLELLLKINENRARFTHDAESTQNENLFSGPEIIGKLLEIAKEFQLQKIYPTTFRVLREITNEYNVSYLEVLDENEKQWTVKTDYWIVPGTIGMMYSKTEVISVFPLIVSMFW